MFTSYYKNVQGQLELIHKYNLTALQDEALLTSLRAARPISPSEPSDEVFRSRDDLPPLPSSEIIPENSVREFTKDEMAAWASVHREPSPLPPEKESRTTSLMVGLSERMRVGRFKRKRSPSPDIARSRPCQGLSDRTYRGFVRIEGRGEAERFALKMGNLPCKSETAYRIVLWTDGSVVYKCAAGAVVWKSPPSYRQWDGEGFPLPYKTNSSGLVELFAIAHALKIAVDQLKELQKLASIAFHSENHDVQIQPGYHVFVFTDSSEALLVLRDGRARHSHEADLWNEYIRKCVKHHSELRRLGANVELHLVPGHKGVPGNEEADRLAKRTARSLALERGCRQEPRSQRIIDVANLAIHFIGKTLSGNPRGSEHLPIPIPEKPSPKKLSGEPRGPGHFPIPKKPSGGPQGYEKFPIPKKLSGETRGREDPSIPRSSGTDIAHPAVTSHPNSSADDGSKEEEPVRKEGRWRRILRSMTPHTSFPAPLATNMPIVDRDIDEWIID
ncbi:hypothetical protein PENDEC_c011G03372 [Penicillium decumbens]|uniref:RNase H type-1 domain-containing protein n=1 Tax=Penicillium decumbens TaxID=69771 RepID=A0A1V6PBD6_PENDC|nr:hypothetical protein PENDEC_c011G03372 [Penicillium decumbens]